MKLVDKANFPKEIFDQPAAPATLAQAVRVHLANQRQGTQSALTRAEISRTRKKYQKQKGSGNARHGDRKAPIFVGGGVTFAPKPRDHSLKLPEQMRRKALFGALTAKAQDKSLFVVSGMIEMSGKTSEAAEFVNTIADETKKHVQKLLLITDLHRENIYRASRNISGVTIMPVNQVNPYEILNADKILIMEEAISLFGKSEQQKEVKTEKKLSTVNISKPVVKSATKTKTSIAKPVVKKAKTAAKK